MSAPTLLDRLDAAVASGAAKLWSELLSALAIAGQSGAGARYFPPDLPGADESAGHPESPRAAAVHGNKSEENALNA